MNRNFGFRISDFGFKIRKIRNPQSTIRNSQGFTYVALLAAIVIIGIVLGSAGKYRQNVMLREKEEELLFRGDQYRTAIERYYHALPGKQVFPQNIEDLLKDNRTAVGKRHLRKQFKDPVTGEDFVVIRDKEKGNRIVGVQSGSQKKPIKQGNFPDPYGPFAGAEKYSDWKFAYSPQQPGKPKPTQ